MINPIRNNLVIELHIPDFVVAKEFYGKLGFVVISEDPVGELPGYMVMQRNDELGPTLLNFYGGDERVYNQSFFKKFPRETPRGFEMEVTIPVKDISSFYESIQKDMGKYIVRVLMEKRDINRVWQDFRMEDPFGFYLRFTELIDWGQPI